MKSHPIKGRMLENEMDFDPLAMRQSVNKIMTAQMKEGGAPAMLGQVEQGNLSLRLAKGVVDVETKAPATLANTYENGSQTKMMTAVLVLQLVEQGKIGLEDKIADLLPPEMTAGLTNADQATVRQLLNMTAGIANYTEAVDEETGLPAFADWLLDHPGEVFGPEQALDMARGMEPTGAPGESYHYSNTNFLLLGQMLQAVTGKDFHELLAENIFAVAGMPDSGRILDSDPARLSSYFGDVASGQALDVTGLLWECVGESGVATTTQDMGAFIRALLVDKTLLSAEMLAEMTIMVSSSTQGDLTLGYGMGLGTILLDSGLHTIGHNGQTAGTVSTTDLNMLTGAIVTLAATSSGVNIEVASLMIHDLLTKAKVWQAVKDDGGPLQVQSGTAAQMRLIGVEDGLRFELAGAGLTLDRQVDRLTTGNLRFADGSVLVVGDNRKGQAGDALGNDHDILRDFAKAADKNNQLIGLAGNDRLAGGLGDDRLAGGDGSDHLLGRAGDDRLVGGAGADVLTGGQGADVFVFNSAGARDVIRDFARGQDHLSLAGLADELIFIRKADFHGQAGELRFESVNAGIEVQVDLDGDGQSDLAILLRGVGRITADDLIL
jgi:D-alanyl-D-alanine carboxypeptidase